MCTAIMLPGGFFGRNLDLETTPGERVFFCPREAVPAPRLMKGFSSRSSLLGMAHVTGGVPLYYDAMNEHGLAMAALHFPGECVYHDIREGCVNLAPFEVMAAVLAACRTMDEARAMLRCMNIVNIPYSPALQNTPLHFILASKEQSLVIESTQDGLHIYDNPAMVMTNAPQFPSHLENLLKGAPLPGDLSSPSRFVRAAYAAENSACPEGVDPAMQLFHLLDFVAVPRGCERREGGKMPYTVYACSMDLERKIYYYKTYGEGDVKKIRFAEGKDG